MGNNNLQREVFLLLKVIASFFGAIALLCLGVYFYEHTETVASPEYLSISESPSDIYYMNYDVTTLSPSPENDLIRFGAELFMNTPNYIGPETGSDSLAYSGNNLSCNNCHLLGGTKPYAAPLLGIIQRFPQYRGREDKMGTIEERIDGCMERSMNGRVFSSDTEIMKGLVAYLTWLSRYAPEDGDVEGQGFLDIRIPERAVDPEHGEAVFIKHCVLCHGPTGKGVRLPDSRVYQYPPLWGDDSFNNGAGMTRVITAAQFIKGNMPYGTTYRNPVLTDEEAYDVAGYINMQPRPKKPDLHLDFPNLLKKPVSTPYPPFADPFPLEQHQKGPFQPIMAFYKSRYGIEKDK